jgi:hypothetical protein
MREETAALTHLPFLLEFHQEEMRVCERSVKQEAAG